MIKPIVVCGPTASGKTRLAIELAKTFDGEIVSADSMQIYREMDIGTSKPTAAEQAQAKHHMIDIVDPGESFSVAMYSEMAAEVTHDIIRRGKTPIICGGTGLYINALISGVKFAQNGSDSGIRQELENEAEAYGVDVLLHRLSEVDPAAAQKLHIKDKKRIIRALEVYYETGKTITQHNEESRKVPPRFDAVFIGIRPKSRELLYSRINSRVDDMMSQGLLSEVQKLYSEGKLRGTAAQAIGYKELLAHITANESLENAVETLKQKTRNYAKRQLTWFNADERVNFVEYDICDNFDFISRKATAFLQKSE